MNNFKITFDLDEIIQGKVPKKTVERFLEHFPNLKDSFSVEYYRAKPSGRSCYFHHKDPLLAMGVLKMVENRDFNRPKCEEVYRELNMTNYTMSKSASGSGLTGILVRLGVPGRGEKLLPTKRHDLLMEDIHACAHILGYLPASESAFQNLYRANNENGLSFNFCWHTLVRDIPTANKRQELYFEWCKNNEIEPVHTKKQQNARHLKEINDGALGRKSKQELFGNLSSEDIFIPDVFNQPPTSEAEVVQWFLHVFLYIKKYKLKSINSLGADIELIDLDKKIIIYEAKKLSSAYNKPSSLKVDYLVCWIHDATDAEKKWLKDNRIDIIEVSTYYRRGHANFAF